MCPYIAKELKKTGVTLKQLWWEEYRQQDPQGLKYTQFCYHFKQWRQDEKLSMHIEHKTGDKMFVDYTGKKMTVTDRKTGETSEIEIFVAVLPARVRKPKDKAHVENAVKLIYQRVFAPLRNEVFYSIEELNQAIKERLEEHNSRKLSKMTVSRRELFEEVEKNELEPLPVYPYPIRHIQNNTLVQFNYHVELKEDRHYYSVPYSLKGERVKLIYDERNVSIYHDNIRIVLHKRDYRNNKYTTTRSHMPEKHRFDDKWNPGKLKWWAGNIGDETRQAVSYILESKPHPEQAYKSCLGILSLATKYGHGILNMACRIACNIERINYGFITEEVKKLKEQYGC